MNAANCVETLIDGQYIPRDAEVVSTNNKVVVISRSEQLVARISLLADDNERDDPHDLRYSHRVSWLAGGVAPVVRPFQEQPTVTDTFVISSYPLLRNGLDMDERSTFGTFGMVDAIGRALPNVSDEMTLRHLDVPQYVHERLQCMTDDSRYDQKLVDYLTSLVVDLQDEYPFEQLTAADPALVHGDMKSDNIVTDSSNRLLAIDMDAAAVGPGLYDLASWRLRCELGDTAAIESVADVGRQSSRWNEEAYRSLIGWKAVSSMSFSLRYETASVYQKKVPFIAEKAFLLGGLSEIPYGERATMVGNTER